MSKPRPFAETQKGLVSVPGEPFRRDDLDLRFLTLAQVQMIDQALEEIGPFGEVRLIKAKGRLRFIQKLESQDALAGQLDE